MVLSRDFGSPSSGLRVATHGIRADSILSHELEKQVIFQWVFNGYFYS